MPLTAPNRRPSLRRCPGFEQPPTDRYADEVALQAVEFFWKEFAARYRGRSVIFAYDLLNEPEIRWDTPPLRAKWNRWLEKKYANTAKLAQAWGGTNQNLTFGSIPTPPKEDCAGCARLLDFQRFREDLADDWTRQQVAAIKTADPQALVTVGLIQWSVPSVLAACWHYSAFRPERTARFVDFMEVHFYPLANGFYEYKPEDEPKNLAYLESVVREVARCGKPVVIAEFGWYGGGKLSFDNHAFASEEQQARWCGSLVRSTAGLACGWLNWGFHDHPGARDPTEFSGLLTSDGKLKAWGNEFNALAAKYVGRKIKPAKLGPRPPLDWDLCITSAADSSRNAMRPVPAALSSSFSTGQFLLYGFEPLLLPALHALDAFGHGQNLRHCAAQLANGLADFAADFAVNAIGLFLVPHVFAAQLLLGLRRAKQIRRQFRAAHVIEDVLLGPQPLPLVDVPHSQPAVQPSVAVIHEDGVIRKFQHPREVAGGPRLVAFRTDALDVLERVAGNRGGRQ